MATAAETTTERAEVRAQAKYVRTSARKARIVLDHIRGRTVPEARTVLAFTPRAVASEIDKVLRSAVANAEANHSLIGDELVVTAAYADEGPTMKRWRPRARGRAARIMKRTCHITVVLAERERLAGGRRRRAGAAAEEAPERAAPEGEKTTESAEGKPRRKKQAEEAAV
jgi:large subunit ribosomal protein L22